MVILNKIKEYFLLISSCGLLLVYSHPGLADSDLSSSSSDKLSAEIAAGTSVSMATRSPGKISRQYVDGRFGQMHVYRIDPVEPSQNTPLICFHPTAVSGDYYRDFMLEMGKDRTVIAIDTPGYGRSDPPTEPQSMAELAFAVADAMDALGYGKTGTGAVDVIGYHTGVYIATEIAVSRPDLIRRLVLPGIPYFTGEERVEQYKKNAKATPIAEDGSGLMKNWEFWITNRHPEVSLKRGTEHLADYLQSGDRSWWAYHSVFTYKAEERLPLLKQKVLVANNHGGLEENSRAAAKLMPNSTLLEMPDLHHGIFDIAVPRLAKVSRNFLDQTD